MSNTPFAVTVSLIKSGAVNRKRSKTIMLQRNMEKDDRL